MAITRSQMRRQLYRGGGRLRQNYGLGDLVRKIIPKEIAQVATVAAPFVAPFNPIAAGLMRGVGRYQQRGSLSDALKQGLGTYGLGQAARYIGGAGMQKGIDPRGGMSGIMHGPEALNLIGPGNPFGLNESLVRSGLGTKGKLSGLGKFFTGGDNKESVFKSITDIVAKPFETLEGMGRAKAMLAVGAIGTGVALVVDKLVGDKDPGESMDEYMTRRKSTVSEYLRYYYKNVNPLASEKEVAEFVRINSEEYGKAKGGRIGYALGSLDAGAQSITYEGNMKMASAPSLEDSRNEMSLMLFGKPIHELNEQELELLNEHSRSGNQQSGIMVAAKGGRIGYNLGVGPAGLPGIPRMAPDGMEYDMSQNGGFQALGAQEGKDDIKANLAKNEFVFTADAVRGAGDGDVEVGAQRMYDTMKRLEGRVVA